MLKNIRISERCLPAQISECAASVLVRCIAGSEAMALFAGRASATGNEMFFSTSMGGFLSISSFGTLRLRQAVKGFERLPEEILRLCPQDPVPTEDSVDSFLIFRRECGGWRNEGRVCIGVSPAGHIDHIAVLGRCFEEQIMALVPVSLELRCTVTFS